MRKSLWIILAVLLVALGAPTAYADGVFTLGNHPQPNEQNILFGSTQMGATVFGSTNFTDTTEQFSSKTDALMVTSFHTSSIGLLKDCSRSRRRIHFLLYVESYQPALFLIHAVRERSNAI